MDFALGEDPIDPADHVGIGATAEIVEGTNGNQVDIGSDAVVADAGRRSVTALAACQDAHDMRAVPVVVRRFFASVKDVVPDHPCLPGGIVEEKRNWPHPGVENRDRHPGSCDAGIVERGGAGVARVDGVAILANRAFSRPPLGAGAGAGGVHRLVGVDAPHRRGALELGQSPWTEPSRYPVDDTELVGDLPSCPQDMVEHTGDVVALNDERLDRIRGLVKKLELRKTVDTNQNGQTGHDQAWFHSFLRGDFVSL